MQFKTRPTAPKPDPLKEDQCQASEDITYQDKQLLQQIGQDSPKGQFEHLYHSMQTGNSLGLLGNIQVLCVML